MTDNKPSTSTFFLCTLAGLVMAYGWGYRGIVGHEGGAMVPGAMLGLAVCLGSMRSDWHRRSLVAGLFGAVGWAWGGSFSYMEQTFYTVTDSFLDVVYGYSCLFLLGGIWAGIGGGVLGLALTLPRSHLERFVPPFVAISGVFLATYGVFFFFPEVHDRYDRLTAQHFHDADWFPTITVAVVAGLHMLLRPRERAEAGLFFSCALFWWIGYLGLTKFGGLNLAPPYRNEGWGGVLGILVAVALYLKRHGNRAALMLCLYGVVGGGLAFAVAVFVRHPVRVLWGPFEAWGGRMHWKIAEESFGLFMGVAIALGVVRLAHGGLAAAPEDTPRRRLDVFAAFVVLIALMWMNLRRAPIAWLHRYDAVPNQPVAGLMPWVWFTAGGLLLTALALYILAQYWRGTLTLLPSGAYAKGTVALILLLWVVAVGGLLQHLPGARVQNFPLVDATFFVLAGAVTFMLLWHQHAAAQANVPGPSTEEVTRADQRWRVGRGYALVWSSVPVVLVLISVLSMAMQDGPAAGARQRFGPDAYWRQAVRVMGRWEALGMVNDPGQEIATSAKSDAAANLPLTMIEFKRDRSAAIALRSGDVVEDAHRWGHKDSRVWLDWFGRRADHPERTSLPMTLRGERLYVPWPPSGETEPRGYVVLGRSGE